MLTTIAGERTEEECRYDFEPFPIDPLETRSPEQLRVPSVVLKADNNLLINSKHPAMDEVEIVSVGKFVFDSGLWKTDQE